jgi:hypothetical protein
MDREMVYSEEKKHLSATPQRGAATPSVAFEFFNKRTG